MEFVGVSRWGVPAGEQVVPDAGKVSPPTKVCRPDKKSELFMAQLTEAKITKEEGLVSHASPKKGGTPMKVR